MVSWKAVSSLVCILCLSASCSQQSKRRPETNADLSDVVNSEESIKVNVVKESFFCNVQRI